EVYDFLRLLWARIGIPHCPVCGEVITKQTPQPIVDQLLELEMRTNFRVLAPGVRSRKREFVGRIIDLHTQRSPRAIVAGEQISLTEPPTLEKQYKHTISVVVDRLVAKPGMRPRLTDAVETALGLAEGRIDIDLVDEGRTRTFSEHMSCPNEHPLTIDEIEP